MMNPEKQLSASSTGVMKTLSRHGFLAFGVGHIAYIRLIAPEDEEAEEKRVWGVYSADGNLLDRYISAGEAVSAARADDLHPIRVH